MKKFIAIAAALSMIATPALADEHRGGHEYHERHGGVSTGGAVAIGLGALILGGLLSSGSRNRDRSYQDQDQYEYAPPARQLQYVCQNEYVRDYYGNYILDQYGRAIFRQHCWYQ